MRTLAALLIAAISAGWVIPVWLGVSFYLGFWHTEGMPLLLGRPHLNSMDFLPAAQGCFKVGILWAGVTLFGWSFVGAHRLLARPADKQFVRIAAGLDS